MLADITDARHVESFGKKGGGLHWLSVHRLPIPNTLVVPYSTSEMLDREADAGFARLRDQLKDKIQPEKLYAVRSSANLEDDRELSFAGQFLSRTNVQGLDAVIAAVREALNSSRSETLQPYMKKLGEAGKQLKMAVLVQDMITPQISGVAFSKNPTTGLDEVVIEAVHGLGETLMQDGITPERWIYRWGQFTAKSESDAALEPVIREIANGTRHIQKIYGSPVDLEWAYDGSKVYWLQIRPITALTNVPLYSNRISREVLPGIIKPLTASVNIPPVNTAWIRLFDSLMGSTHLKPEDLTKLFHYRAYFNMGSIGTIFEILGFPREGLEMLLGFKLTSKRPPFRPSWKTFQHIPRMLGFAAGAWAYDRRVQAELMDFETRIRNTQAEDVSSLSAQQYMMKVQMETLLSNYRISTLKNFAIAEPAVLGEMGYIDVPGKSLSWATRLGINFDRKRWRQRRRWSVLISGHFSTQRMAIARTSGIVVMSQLNSSARAYHCILKLARTITDLAGSKEIGPVHMADRIQSSPAISGLAPSTFGGVAALVISMFSEFCSECRLFTQPCDFPHY